MKTTENAVSTICYSTPDFVKMRLDELVNKGLITMYGAMPHPAYTMDGKDRKAHLHLVVVPAKRIDLDSLSAYLEQPDLEHPDKPNLGCEIWKKTRDDFVDWYAYALHDRDYLRFKKAQNKPYYNLDTSDLITNAPDLFERVADEFPRSKWISDMEKIIRAFSSGKSFYDFCIDERIPLSQISTAHRAWCDSSRYMLDQSTRYGNELLDDVAAFAEELSKAEK